MRCAIIRPLAEGRAWELEEPLGAEAICGYLRERGISCCVFDRRIGTAVQDIEAFAPDAAGFSLMTAEDVPDALRLLQKLKKPERRFFAGGLFVTCEEKRCRALFPADTKLISGEGEGPVLSFLTSVDAVPPDPDGWAFASRDDLSAYLEQGGAVHLRSSRGCHGGCAFCTTPGLSHGHHEERSIDLVVQEMAVIAGQGVLPVFNFVDDEFGSLERVRKLIRTLKREGVRAAFSMELRPSVVCGGNPEIWDELHAGGLCRIFTGLENLSRETLRHWNKPTDPQRLLQALELCEKAGILCETGYILFHEGSTVSSVMEQLRMLHDAGRFTPKAALSRLWLYPGSRLHRLSSLKQSAPVMLTAEAEELFSSWEIRLKEYYDLWTKCAVRLPNAACKAFLSGETTEKDLLRQALGRINELSFREVEGRECTAAEKEEMYALCSRALGGR